MSRTSDNPSMSDDKDDLSEYNFDKENRKPRLLINPQECEQLPDYTIRRYTEEGFGGAKTSYINGGQSITTTDFGNQLTSKSNQPLILFEQRIKREDILVSLQKWEGTVLRVKNDKFICRLKDLTVPGADEVAEIPIKEVSDADIDYLNEGAIFEWHIGYKEYKSGTKQRVSTIIFRKLPMWDERELEEARAEGKKLIEDIEWK